jgi:hypothetical protein
VKMPVQSLVVYLPSKGLNERRSTVHTYSHSELVTLPGEKKGTTVTGLGHFYRCGETNELKRWGFDATYAKDTGGN